MPVPLSDMTRSRDVLLPIRPAVLQGSVVLPIRPAGSCEAPGLVPRAVAGGLVAVPVAIAVAVAVGAGVTAASCFCALPAAVLGMVGSTRRALTGRGEMTGVTCKVAGALLDVGVSHVSYSSLAGLRALFGLWSPCLSDKGELVPAREKER